MNGRHYLANVINGTPPPKFMRVRGYMGKREMISLEELEKACAKRGVDVHDVVARGLMEENEEKVGLKVQADLAWKVINKSEPDKKAVQHSTDPDNPLEVTLIERRIIDPGN